MQRACRGKEHAEAKSIDFALTFSPTEKNLTRTEEEHCHAQQKEISTVAHAKKTNYLCPHFNTRRKLCCCVQVLPKHHYDHVVRVKCFNPLTAQQKEMSNCVQSSVVWAWFWAAFAKRARRLIFWVRDTQGQSWVVKMQKVMVMVVHVDGQVKESWLSKKSALTEVCALNCTCSNNAMLTQSKMHNLTGNHNHSCRHLSHMRRGLQTIVAHTYALLKFRPDYKVLQTKICPY